MSAPNAGRVGHKEEAMAKQSENAREELWSFAMKGDLAGVVKFFKRMVEAKRAQLRPATTALLREWRRVRGEDHA